MNALKSFTRYSVLNNSILTRSNSFVFTIFIVITLLTGCDSTQSHASNLITQTVTIERMDEQCITSVNTQQAMLENANTAQYLSLANAAEHCVGNIAYSPRHPDNQTAMQFSALAIMNFIKAGDISLARQGLAKFRATFPQQDLLFPDYSSFVDTATAFVMQQDLSAYQLALLNINPQLRSELARHRKWSL